jgi:hypothetical protein
MSDEDALDTVQVHRKVRRYRGVGRRARGEEQVDKVFFCRAGLIKLTQRRRGVKKTTGSAKKPKLPESLNDCSPSRATHWCTRLESCDTVHRQFVEVQAKAEATRRWEEGGATFLRFSDASELNLSIPEVVK